MSFVTSDPVETLAQDALARTEIVEFFTTAKNGMTNTMGATMSPSRSRAANACTVKTYDITGHLDGSDHGSPTGTSTFTLPASTSTIGLPDESALVIRLESEGRAAAQVETADGADPGSLPDRPKQRHTGRVFFGPLNGDSELQTTVDGHLRPSAAMTLRARQAMEGLALDLAANASYVLGIWSRVDAVVRDAWYIVTDNAYDTQRRRGPGATILDRLLIAP